MFRKYLLRISLQDRLETEVLTGGDQEEGLEIN